MLKAVETGDDLAQFVAAIECLPAILIAIRAKENLRLQLSEAIEHALRAEIG